SAVYYSAGVYNPDVMFFLGSWLALAVWEVTRGNRSRWIFWVAFLFLLMPQFHVSGLLLIPAVALGFWLGSARPTVPWLIAGLAAGVLLYVPYVRGEMSHGWQNTRGIFSSGGTGYSWDALKALTLPINLLVNWVPQWTRTFGEYRELGRACFGSF